MNNHFLKVTVIDINQGISLYNIDCHKSGENHKKLNDKVEYKMLINIDQISEIEQHGIIMTSGQKYILSKESMCDVLHELAINHNIETGKFE